MIFLVLSLRGSVYSCTDPRNQVEGEANPEAPKRAVAAGEARAGEEVSQNEGMEEEEAADQAVERQEVLGGPAHGLIVSLRRWGGK